MVQNHGNQILPPGAGNPTHHRPWMSHRRQWHIVYRWGFPYLDYSFNVLILWSCNLGCTAGFVVFAFIRFLFRFSVLLLLLYYIYGFTTCVLLHWSPAITTLYTTYFMPDITLELLYLTSWLVYFCFIRILSYRIITASWWFILFSLAAIVDSSGCT